MKLKLVGVALASVALYGAVVYLIIVCIKTYLG
jgi:hypothetical protein